MIVTHLALFSFLNGAGGTIAAPPAPEGTGGGNRRRLYLHNSLLDDYFAYLPRIEKKKVRKKYKKLREDISGAEEYLAELKAALENAKAMLAADRAHVERTALLAKRALIHKLMDRQKQIEKKLIEYYDREAVLLAMMLDDDED